MLTRDLFAVANLLV